MPTPIEMVIIPKNELSNLIEDLIFKCLNQVEKSSKDNKEQPDKLLSRKEAAKFIGVSLPTLDSHTNKGSLKARYIGRRILYEEKELLSATLTFKSVIGHKKTGHRNGR